MSSETHDAILGMPEPDASSPAPLKPASPPRESPLVPAPPSSTSSGDELSALLTDSIIHPEPDPFLGEFPKDDQSNGESSPNAEQERESSSGPRESGPPEAEAPSAPSDPVVSESTSGESPLNLGQESPPDGAGTAGSFDALSALATITTGAPASEPPAIDRGPKPSRPQAGDSEEAESEDADDDEDDEDDEHHPPRSSWLTLLLVSYSSAVTLGLIWVLLSGRRLREGDDINLYPATENRVDPGRHANQSRMVIPPSPLAADHLVKLGETSRLGALEATPVEIRLGGVSLEGAFDESDQRPGGADALRLKLRLKNVSSKMIFVPFDEAFIRERVVGHPDSFIETANGGQIAMYPLAVASEWSIQGQEFQELQPGESFDAEVVSATKVSDRLTPEMTWRVRLRTGLDQTDTLGIRFRQDEIR